MTETLLSSSNVLLFGRKVEDLKIEKPPLTSGGVRVRLVATVPLPLAGPQNVDGVPVHHKDRILVTGQAAPAENGIYIADTGALVVWKRADDAKQDEDFAGGMLVRVRKGSAANVGFWKLAVPDPVVGIDPITFQKVDADERHGPFAEPRRGIVGDVEAQLKAVAVAGAADVLPSCFARIYGFSYEGTYYELPRPALFLVHGDGYPATESRIGIRGIVRKARGLGDPSLTGIAAADFDFAEDLKVWSYDKADYTIRMDVETGMFEQVLLDMFFGGGGPGMSGARVSGARVSGARVSGARVSGARLSGGWSD